MPPLRLFRNRGDRRRRYPNSIFGVVYTRLAFVTRAATRTRQAGRAQTASSLFSRRSRVALSVVFRSVSFAFSLGFGSRFCGCLFRFRLGLGGSNRGRASENVDVESQGAEDLIVLADVGLAFGS